MVLRCRDGADDWMAVCSSNGTWIPDLNEIECHNITAVIPSMIQQKKRSLNFLLTFIFTDTINASGNSTDHLIYIITGSVVGSAMLVVLFIAAVIICITLCSKNSKSTISSQDRPDLPVYETISGPVYEYLNPTVTPVMTENEAYTTGCKEFSAYKII
jgi:hypothetical protein